MFGSCFRVLAAWLLFAGLVGGAQAEISLAYVNAARVLKEAPQVQLIKQRIRDEFKARDQRLVEMKKQIALLESKLGGVDKRPLAEEATRRLQSDISARKLKYKQARDELDQDKQLRFSEEQEHLARIIHEVIQQVAQDEKLDIVLQGGVMWVSPRVDITKRILTRLQQMLEQGN